MDARAAREAQSTVPSPCVQQCGLTDRGWCTGCGRTGDEVARWSGMDDTERRQVVTQAKARLQGR